MPLFPQFDITERELSRIDIFGPPEVDAVAVLNLDQVVLNHDIAGAAGHRQAILMLKIPVEVGLEVDEVVCNLGPEPPQRVRPS